MTTLREAAQHTLDFIENHSRYWNGTGVHPQTIVSDLRAALAEDHNEEVLEMVEPVAWMYDTIAQDGSVLKDWVSREHPQESALEEERPHNFRRLYTAPQPRRRLTDEEIAQALAEPLEPVASVTVEQDDYKAWYEEAMNASNEYGFVGLDAAQTIRELARMLAEASQPKAKQQEPVATVTSETGNPEVTMSWWHEPALPVGTKLYTTPRPRKRLTDEEIDALELPPSGTATVRDLVRLIERAYGITGEMK
jgi:hypothetical protein